MEALKRIGTGVISPLSTVAKFGRYNIAFATIGTVGALYGAKKLFVDKLYNERRAKQLNREVAKLNSLKFDDCEPENLGKDSTPPDLSKPRVEAALKQLDAAILAMKYPPGHPTSSSVSALRNGSVKLVTTSDILEVRKQLEQEISTRTDPPSLEAFCKTGVAERVTWKSFLPAVGLMGAAALGMGAIRMGFLPRSLFEWMKWSR